MRNIKELRDELTTVFTELRGKVITIDDAKEASRVAGKIIGTVKVEIDYKKLTKDDDKKIDFLEY